jgi:uncharacterized membrane protein YuzA (DUF378 family)
MEVIKRLEPLAMFVMVLGALNWGMVGLFDKNVIGDIFSGTALDVVYTIVGVAGLMYVPKLMEELHIGGHHPRPHGA